jgi:hypothetical protein
MARNANDFEQLYRDDPDKFVELVANGYSRLNTREMYELGKFINGALNPSLIARVKKRIEQTSNYLTPDFVVEDSGYQRIELERLSDDQFAQVEARWENSISQDYEKLKEQFELLEGAAEDDASTLAERGAFGTIDGLPIWLFDSFPSDHPFQRDNAARGRILQRLVLYFNTQFGQEYLDTPILSSPEEVIEYLTRMGPETEMVQNLIQFAAADVQPDAGFRIVMSSGSSVFVTASDQQVMSDIYGMRAEDITSMVRIVDMIAGSDEFAAATEGFDFFPNGMEGVNYKAFAALFKMDGHLETVMRVNTVDSADMMNSSGQRPMPRAVAPLGL